MPTSFTAQTRCCTVRYCHAVNTSKHVTEMVEGVPEPLRQLCRRQFLLQMLCNIVPASSRVLSVTHSLHHLGLYFITYLPHLLFRSCEVPMNGQSFSRPRSVYGDMQAFVQMLKDMGYERVELIDTTDGSFMTPKEARHLMLLGSTLLVGRK